MDNREYCDFYANNFDNLDEINRCLERPNLPRFTEETALGGSRLRDPSGHPTRKSPGSLSFASVDELDVHGRTSCHFSIFPFNQ